MFLVVYREVSASARKNPSKEGANPSIPKSRHFRLSQRVSTSMVKSLETPTSFCPLFPVNIFGCFLRERFVSILNHI